MDGVTLAVSRGRAARSANFGPALSPEEAAVVRLIERRFLKTA